MTGKEHDAETGLENFGARYDSSSMGRFMTPDWSAKPEDVPYADLTNPQTFDLYAFVRDNPDTFADLDGHQDGGPEADPEVDIYEGEKAEEEQEWSSPASLEHGAAPLNYWQYNGGDDPLSGMCYVGAKNAPDRTANDPVRRDANGRLIPDPEANGAPHTQLATRNSKSQPGTSYKRGVEYDKDGNPVRDTHHTDHGMPKEHANPHYHDIDPKTQEKDPAKPLTPPPSPKPPPPPPQPQMEN